VSSAAEVARLLGNAENDRGRWKVPCPLCGKSTVITDNAGGSFFVDGHGECQCSPWSVRVAIDRLINGHDPPPPRREPKSDDPEGVITKSLASYSIEPIDWLWAGWLARGKLHMLAGQGGGGKSTLALGFAAIITRGGEWPDGTIAAKGRVLIWSGEDEVKDTILPRFLAMGGDPTMVDVIHAVDDGKGPRRFNPATDMAKLAAAIERIGDDLALSILDPISSAYVGDSHKDAEVRSSLQPIVDLAERFGFAVLGIAHFAKNSVDRVPVERVMGSAAVGNLPRLVMAVVRPDDRQAPRRLVRVKSNIGPDGGGFEFDLTLRLVHRTDHDEGIPAQFVDWGQFIEGSPRELFGVEQPAKEDAVAEAMEFLRELLAVSPLTSKEIRKAAEANGHSWRTISRAKKKLGIKSSPTEFQGDWEWSLPPQPERRRDHDDE
jgi:putative DNA primase/helicase